jgi:hypothetical protein
LRTVSSASIADRAAAPRLLAASRGLSYLGAALALMASACARPPAAVVPLGAFTPVSVAAFRALAARTVPVSPVALYFHWRYDDGSAPVRGRGAARVAPPDSLRLDVGLPIVGRATLVLAGDSVWAQPEAAEEHLLSERGTVWALFGVIEPPQDGTRIEVGEAADRRLYRLTAPGGVVTTLELRGDTLLGATQQRGDRVIGRLVLTRNAAGALVQAAASDPQHGLRFVVDLDRREAPSESFPSEIWRRP